MYMKHLICIRVVKVHSIKKYGGGGVNGHLLNITGLSNITYATSNKLIHE